MNATKTRTIGLWLDAIGGDEPKWIVSEDERYDDGDVASSRTVAMHSEQDYDSAFADALARAEATGRALVKTDRYGRREELISAADAAMRA